MDDVTCQMCGQKFSSEEELDEHNRAEHGNGDDDEEE